MLCLEAFTARVGGSEAFELQAPSLSVGAGSLVFIVGKNGSGKTLFLRHLAGEIDYSLSSEGVWLSTADERWRTRERRLSIVRQQADQNLALELTVGENLLLRMPPRIVAGLTPGRKLEEIARLVLQQDEDLLDRLNSLAGDLSNGQRQRLAFACVASQGVKILLLDEHLAAVDEPTGELLREYCSDYAARNAAYVFIVTHDWDVAIEDGDRILVFDNGHIVADVHKDSPDWQLSFLSATIRRGH